MEVDLYYIQVLKSEFESRKLKNGSYSLRAFAKNLSIDPSLFSKIFNEKQLPTLETANTICTKLNLKASIAKRFMESIAEEKACVELYKINPNYTDCKD